MSQTATAPINPITNQPYSTYYNPGRESGAILLEWRGPVLVASVRSFTNPRGPRHTIECNTRTGRMTCSCEAFKFAKGPGQPICKHIDRWASFLACEIREKVASGDLVRATVYAAPIPAYTKSEDPF